MHITALAQSWQGRGRPLPGFSSGGAAAWLIPAVKLSRYKPFEAVLEATLQIKESLCISCFKMNISCGNPPFGGFYYYSIFRNCCTGRLQAFSQELGGNNLCNCRIGYFPAIPEKVQEEKE